MEAVRSIVPMVSVAQACRALGVSRATFYRSRHPAPGRKKRPRPCPARALSPSERAEALELLHSPRFVDLAPPQVHAKLLTEGRYLCSTRTFYRILAVRGEVRERRCQRVHPAHPVPVLHADGPNQVWSWDITKLRGMQPREIYSLYTVIDIFSRLVVAWMLARRESADHAVRLIEEAYDRQGIVPGALTLHADRGSPMIAQSTAALLAKLGIDDSHSRPRVSNDNPFIESHFKTLKYRPDFPGRFESYEHAIEHCRAFFGWYNEEHQHSGIAWLTPADVHYGRSVVILDQRQRTLDDAYTAHPERFVRGRPVVTPLPARVSINPDSTTMQVTSQ